MTPASGSRKLFIEGPAGKLEALWRSGGSPANFARAAIVCHPHPLYGGTMENKIVARCARDVSARGIEAVRFNFRGVGLSKGTFDSGRGERDDLSAVIEYVRGISDARLAIVGFSFGAWIALEVGADRPEVDVLVGIAPPVRMFEPGREIAPGKKSSLFTQAAISTRARKRPRPGLKSCRLRRKRTLFRTWITSSALGSMQWRERSPLSWRPTCKIRCSI